MAISLQEELNKRNKDKRPYWVQFDEASKAKSKKNKEFREKGDKAANRAKAKNFTQHGITYSNLGFPVTNIVDPSQARETAVRNELLRRENIEDKHIIKANVWPTTLKTNLFKNSHKKRGANSVTLIYTMPPMLLTVYFETYKFTESLVALLSQPVLVFSSTIIFSCNL